jgi:hypothetical protein
MQTNEWCGRVGDIGQNLSRVHRPPTTFKHTRNPRLNKPGKPDPDFNDLANRSTGLLDGCKGVPEPSTLLILLNTGAVGLVACVHRRRKRAA